ncbi:hypothetical protein Stsp01_06430 [Streptomyces sp. NBRC 13847]|nr:hypothetical protein Stsp01_06430 [Streptomyces sp. NBRC 13847]
MPLEGGVVEAYGFDGVAAVRVGEGAPEDQSILHDLHVSPDITMALVLVAGAVILRGGMCAMRELY